MPLIVDTNENTVLEEGLNETTPSPESGVTVYTKEGCPPCKATVRALTKKGIPFTALSIENTPGARDIIANLGYAQAPVVIAGEDSWSGFNPDRINALAK